MTIQVPNPGTGNGATGDNEFVLWSKVKANFEDQTNAASRLIGNDSGQLTLAENISTANYKYVTSDKSSSGVDLNTAKAGDVWSRVGGSSTNIPSSTTFKYTGWTIVTRAAHSAAGARDSYSTQIAYSYNPVAAVNIRNNFGDTWGDWQPIADNPAIYNRTTASGANVAVDANGKLMRSTSSERYKYILADLELDDAAYNNAMQLAPIVYRSTADADNPEYHYYSFSAEALGAYDPAFTLWRDTEIVTDDEGNTSEQPLDERQAEGINLNAIVAFLHATNVKQGKLISELEAKVLALENEV